MTIEVARSKRVAPRPYEFHGYFVEALLRPGDAHKARVLLARRDDVRVVIKDLSPMRPFFRRLYGRRMLAREARALEALQSPESPQSLGGFEGSPRLVERISRDALVIEFVNAIYLRKSVRAERRPAVMRELRRVVERLHRRGVVHLDLRQRKNILVSRSGRVTLIDFESSLVLGDGMMGRALMRLLGPIDRTAVMKWQAKYAPQILSDADERRFARFERLKRLWFLKRLGRTLRRLVPRG